MLHAIQKTARLLLVLDLDDTLVFPSLQPLTYPPDYLVRSGWNEYYFYKRPFLEDFLLTCAAHFDLAIWSSGSKFFVLQTLQHILPAAVQPVLVWDKSKCTYYKDKNTGQAFYSKPLHKLQDMGYSLARILVLDNTPEKLWQDRDNLIAVSPFSGDTSDRELLFLRNYLLNVKDVEDVRKLEKNIWRNNQCF